MRPAPPTALPPRPRLIHRLRAARAARRRGITVEGLPLIGRNVVFDLAGGATLTIGDGAVLMDGCRVHARGGTVTIGDGAFLGDGCVILCHQRIDVGPHASIADRAALIDFRHRFSDTERPVREQGLVTRPVTVPAGARVGPEDVVA